MDKPRVSNRIGTSLWFLPVLCILAGLICSLATIAIDRAFDYDLIPRSVTGGPDAALQIFNTIAASMVSLAALVLTITMVVVQLAMGQFSPRIVQTILRDKPSQLAIGVFVATFAHSMLAMREVKLEPQETVPGVAVVVAYVLVFASIVLLVAYVHHLGQALRVSALIELVGTDTRRLIDRLPVDAPEGADPNLVVAPISGVVTALDVDTLVAVATDTDCLLEVVPALGQFVPAGAPLVRVHGEPGRLRADDLASAVTLKLERTLDHDIAYGFRLLVDIGERSLSDSPYQDPTTAVQAIDRLHDALRQLACRPLPDGIHYDETGAVRLVAPAMDWDAYVHLAFDEIRMAGARSPQVTRRLSYALDDLLTIAPADRAAALEEQRALLRQAVDDEQLDARIAEFALRSDPEGIGEAVTRTRTSRNGPAGAALR